MSTSSSVIQRAFSLTMAAVLLVAFTSCANMSRTQKGAILGSSSGAVVGGVIGKQAGNTAVGAILGAAVGGVAGAYIGNYMDKQAAEIERDIEGATVERVGEGIKITFDSGLLFDVNQSSLQPQARHNLEELAAILQKYEDTEVLIEGHTDASGSADHNMTLSRNRAYSVAAVLEGQHVAATRFTIMGYGESQPVADNETARGRQANRRVDLAIMANDKLKSAAEKRAS
jgi:outer membrane protein OmpA-like peptidoglycan-associated protein